MIARALATALIICDEPVSTLDVYVHAKILDLIADLQAQLGMSLLFILHDLGAIHHVSDRALVFQNGRIVEQGDVAEVFSRPQYSYRQSLISSLPRSF